VLQTTITAAGAIQTAGPEKRYQKHSKECIERQEKHIRTITIIKIFIVYISNILYREVLSYKI